MFQAVSLFLGYFFFLMRLVAARNSAACYAMAVLTHYFFLTGYFWCFLFALEIIRTISALYAVDQRSKTQIMRFHLNLPLSL